MSIRRTVIQVLGLSAFALGVSVSAAAQPVPRAEVSGGYQFLNVSVEGEAESLGAGWYVDVAGNLNQMIGIVVEAGGSYKSATATETFRGAMATATADLRVHNFMGGARFSARQNPTVVPYAQLLAGGVNLSAEVSAMGSVGGIPISSFSGEDSQTNVAVQVGGGVNVMLTDSAGIRAGIDYLRIFEDESGANVLRFIAGVVLPF